MGPYTHQGSKNNLLGKTPEAALVEDLSNEKRVSKETPPTFVFHSTLDKAVVVQNADMYVGALAANGVKYTYVRGEYGAHGVGLTDAWREHWLAWLSDLGYARVTAPGAGEPEKPA
jgi:dipeptidyl aminopeptidase/acylaminoacyl peptidase